ncbi:MAG: ABC transporter permease [Pseudomonadota bacterium]|nr:ABC transporter permease [Pseudomonadota bacterium]
MNNTIVITPLDLITASILILSLAGLTAPMSFGLSRSMLIAAARTTLQLLLIGLVLKALFAHADLWWVAGIALVMLLVAGGEIMARQTRWFTGLWGYGLGAISTFISSFTVTLLALTVVIGPQPWYAPRYAIPLLGMIMGNTMTGVAVGLDNLTNLAWRQRAVIEARLMLGHDWRAAIADIHRESVHRGLIPIINAMATAGIVSLPGMMTGQILAGNPPVEAVKYQILIMFLVASGTGFGTLGALALGARRLFDERQRLRLDRLRPPAHG